MIRRPSARSYVSSNWYPSSQSNAHELAVCHRRAATAPDEEALGLVGAGPLENHLGHAEAEIAWVEDRCRSLPGFVTALTTVWGLEDYPERFILRAERAAGEPFIRRT